MTPRRRILFGAQAFEQAQLNAFKTRVQADSGAIEAEECLKAQIKRLQELGLYDKASLLVTPNAYKASKIYSLKPTSGAGDLTFARASVKRRRNASGNSEEVASGVPALQYPVGGGCPSWLIETQRTNGIRNNSMVGAVAGTPGTIPTNWFINAPAGISTQVVGIGVQDGINYIDIRYFGTGSGLGNITFEQSVIAALNGQIWTNSFWFQVIAGSSANCTLQSRIAERNSGGGAVTEGLQTIVSPTSWLRNTFTRTLSGGGTVAFVIPAILLNFASATHDFTMRIGLPQMEQGAFATSEIITSGSALTRVADDLTTAGLSAFIGQAQGVFAAKMRIPSLFANYIISLNDTTINNRIYIGINASNQIEAALISNNVIQAFIAGGSVSVGVDYNIVASYGSNYFALFVNGVKLGQDLSVVPFANTVSRLSPNSAVGAGAFQGNLGPIYIGNTLPSDAECIALSNSL